MRESIKDYSALTVDERIEILIDFNKSISKSQTDLLPCFSKVVDDKFWDLIEKPKGNNMAKVRRETHKETRKESHPERKGDDDKRPIKITRRKK